MKEVAERMKVPRALHTRFPVGLSLGKPKDPEFQLQVLQAAFGLLEAASGQSFKLMRKQSLQRAMHP